MTRRLREGCMFEQAGCEFGMPCHVADYTDFYASVFHATNVGSMFRPDNPLLPNYKHIPIGYHGRASSLIAADVEIVRPTGQLSPPDDGGAPGFGPCQLLDYEMEMGFFVAEGNRLGQRVPIAHAAEHLFGFCLVNDWSARDLQKWEYQPLGPFLAKSFATSVSPMGRLLVKHWHRFAAQLLSDRMATHNRWLICRTRRITAAGCLTSRLRYFCNRNRCETPARLRSG